MEDFNKYMRETKKVSDSLKTVERTLQILEAFSLQEPEYTAYELAQKIGIPQSTIYRFLRILVRKGFLEQDPITKKFRLGIRVFELGSIVLKNMKLHKIALPFIEELSNKSGETVHLGILDGYEVVSIESIESTHSLRIANPIGKRCCLHSTGIGKAILAFLPDEKIVEIIKNKGLPKFTPNTITDIETLKREISLIRERGYAVDNQENEIGIRCVAAPIRDHTGKVVASISISGPAIRITNGKIPEFAKLVIEVSNKISELLGYKPLE